MLEYLTIGLLISSLLTACGVRMPAQQTSFSLSSSPAPVVIQYELEECLTEDTAEADDGTVLAECHLEYPELNAYLEDGTLLEDAGQPGSAEETAWNAVQTFNDCFDQWILDSDFSKLADWAYKDLESSLEQGHTLATIPFSEELTYTAWQTDHLISVRGQFYTYSGGTHPNTLLLGWNFSLDSGEYITPVVLAENDQTFLENVTEEILRQADLRARDAGSTLLEYYNSDCAEIAAEWTNYAVSFDERGMTVGFSPYELASYAAGCQEFFISYETMDPWLSDYGRQVLGLTD